MKRTRRLGPATGARRRGVHAARGLLSLACVALWAGLTGPGVPGCASAPRSSTLSVDDIEFTADELVHKLSDSDWLRGRTSGSPRVVIAIQKVENLSSDVIPEPDRWYIMTRLRASRPLEAYRRLYNVAFVIPAEHLAASSAQSEAEREIGAGRRPTHELTATFRSATRSAGLDRTDAYQCECRVTDLASGELVWTDTVEFKKTAFGKAYD